MNLADALRKAAMRAEHVTVTPQFTVLPSEAHAFVEKPEIAAAVDAIPTPPADASPLEEFTPKKAIRKKGGTVVAGGPVEEVEEPQAPVAPSPTNTTMVRVELFLGPEQLHLLLSAMTHSQRSVLTLREAAAYLRVTPAKLEQLASDRKVPAFLLDGKWRFSKSGLDEWLALQSTVESEEGEDVTDQRLRGRGA